MTLRPRKGQRLEVQFHGYDDDGQAVAPWPEPGAAGGPGFAIHAPGGAAGERAEVEIQHVSPHKPVAWGRIRRLITTAPHRTRPFEGPAHRCGGCPWGHLSAEEQLRAKGSRLATLAAAFPGATRGDPPVRPSPRPSSYRTRAKYVLGRLGGRVVLGAWAPRSHRLIRTVGCPTTAPAVDAAAAALEALLGAGPWTLFDEARRTGLLRYAGIREGHGGAVLVTLVAAAAPAGPAESLAPLVAGLRERVPGLVGVTLDVNPTAGNVIFSGRERVLWGSGALEEAFGPARVTLTGHGFGQVNRAQAAALYDAAAEAALAPLADGARPGRIWELFCGAGALAQVIAHRGADLPALRVRGVERDAAAVAQARAVAAALGLAHRLRFESGDANRALDGLVAGGRASGAGAEADGAGGAESGAAPDVVALDPPRTGCRPALLEALCQAAVPRVVYVSCDPGTLGRDLAVLAAGGYAVRALQGFDMMPMTPHLEVLAVAERQGVLVK